MKIFLSLILFLMLSLNAFADCTAGLAGSYKSQSGDVESISVKSNAAIVTYHGDHITSDIVTLTFNGKTISAPVDGEDMDASAISPGYYAVLSCTNDNKLELKLSDSENPNVILAYRKYYLDNARNLVILATDPPYSFDVLQNWIRQ